MNQGSWMNLLQRLHRDEKGAVSLETILIVGAIAIPCLIFLVKYAGPRITAYFSTGMDNLETGSDSLGNSGSSSS